MPFLISLMNHSKNYKHRNLLLSCSAIRLAPARTLVCLNLLRNSKGYEPCWGCIHNIKEIRKSKLIFSTRTNVWYILVSLRLASTIPARNPCSSPYIIRAMMKPHFFLLVICRVLLRVFYLYVCCLLWLLLLFTSNQIHCFILIMLFPKRQVFLTKHSHQRQMFLGKNFIQRKMFFETAFSSEILLFATISLQRKMSRAKTCLHPDASGSRKQYLSQVNFTTKAFPS